MRFAWKIAPIPGLSLALLLGCSGGNGDEARPAFESGTRLRAQVADGGEGALVLEAWLDTKLNELCEFHPVKDGSFRCIPVFWGARLVYTDSECKARAAVTNSICDVGSHKYVTSIDEAYTCPTAVPPVAVYSLGAPIARGTAYYVDERGVCTEYGVDIPLVSVTEAPLDTFVAATVSREDMGDGFSVSVFTGEDGSRSLHRIHDASGNECRPALLDEGRIGEAYPCLPAGSASMTNRGPYADAACQQPVQELPGWCPKPSLTVVEEKPEAACDSRKRTIREVGKLVNPAEIHTYNQSGDACYSAGNGHAPRGALYAIGDAVEPELFPSLTWASSGTGRLRSRHWATPSGAQAAVAGGHPLSSSFYDGTLEAVCYASRFDDGRTRCVPAPFRYLVESEYFEDPACKSPIDVERVSDTQCPAGDFVLFARSAADFSGCLAGPPLEALYTVGEPLDDETIYYWDDESKCRKVPDNAGIYALSPLDPATFAEISVRVE
jgi:hypothetical protein